MKVKELKKQLDQFSDDSEVWNLNEGMPTPVSEIYAFEEAPKDGAQHVILA